MVPVVRGIADGGVTVLMIEHVMQAVMNLAAHVWVLAQGQLIGRVGAENPKLTVELRRRGRPMDLTQLLD